MKKKLSNNDYNDIADAAHRISNMIIATYGLHKAILMAKSISEKIQANYNSMKAKYPEEYI